MSSQGKLIFIYGTMNVGKSNDILTAEENYRRSNQKVLLMKPSVDTRTKDSVKSRSGWEKPCVVVSDKDDLSVVCKGYSIILIDEAQFLTKEQIYQIREIVDFEGKRVVCYGLKNTYRGDLFPASKVLIEVSDKLIQKTTLCHCGKNANMILKLDKNGNVIKKGKIFEVGGDDKYYSVCHKHWVMEEFK